MYDNKNQNNIEWFRARLGNIAGSVVGNIMGTPRSKSDKWTATALNYFNQVAFERTMNPIIVNNDDLFSQYLALTDVKSKAIQWGHQMEGEAAHLFAMEYYKYFAKNGQKFTLDLEEPSSVKCKDLPHFASSPDRVFYNPETGEECCVEIKCPQSAAFAKFVNCVFTNNNTKEEILEGLKKADSNYYWQCYAHMLATGASKTYFVIYNPFQVNPMFILEIERDEDILNEMREKITAADEYITMLVAGLWHGKKKSV
jgi:hypothetical protein